MSKEVEKNQVVTIESLSGSTLVNVTEWEQKIQKVLDENPFVEIVDNPTYELQKKRRTAVKTIRVELEKEDKAIGSVFSKVRKEAGNLYEALVLKVSPTEKSYQEEVDRWEQKKEREKEEREAAEQKRIDDIKAKVDEFETQGYDIIKRVVFSGIEDGYKDIEPIVNNTFDFEEYDILWQQARERVIDSYAQKVKDLTEKENQRAENERLARQNARLEKLYPVMEFTEGVELMTLHELSEEAFTALLNGSLKAKAEVDKKAQEVYAEAKRNAEEREQKEREEKEKVFEVRKKRFIDAGFVFKNDEIYYPDFENRSIPLSEIQEADIFDFENIFNSAVEHNKELIRIENDEKSLKERYEKRIAIVSELNMIEKDLEYVSHPSKNNITWGIYKEMILNSEDDIFDTIVNDVREHNSRIKKEAEEDLKTSDKRQRALKKDKELIYDYIGSLQFRDAVPNVSNVESANIIEQVEKRLNEFKENIIHFVNNY